MIFTLRPYKEKSTSLRLVLLELFKTDILFLTGRELGGLSHDSWPGVRSEITQFVAENSIKLIIIDVAVDPCPLDDTIFGYGPSYLNMQSDLKKTCRSIIVTADFTYYYKPIDEDVFFFPYILWIISKNNVQDTLQVTDLEKTHPLMCLNNNLTWHRIYMLMLMYNKPWIDKVDFSFKLPMGNRLENKPHISKYITEEEKKVIRLIPTPIFLDYERDIPDSSIMLKYPNMTIGATDTGLYVNDLVYTRNAINLVTETSITEGIILTEKTVKPILAYQIPIIVGNPGTSQFLEDIGIDMFSDYVPWKEWDQIHYHKERMQKIIDFVGTIMQDTNAILKTHRDFHPRLMKNKERFYSDEFRNLLLKQIS